MRARWPWLACVMSATRPPTRRLRTLRQQIQRNCTSSMDSPRPDGRVVLTKGGGVSGHDRGDTLAFFGIPFASVKRWQPPQPVVSWTGTLEATKIGPACPQSAPHPVPGFAASGAQDEEGCLNLNVFCPAPAAAAASAPAPVLLWVHGGGFTHGAAYEPLYDGGILAGQGAVVVSCNWRLGALGFGFLGDLDSKFSANNGLLDIIAALVWVRDNIAAFGGNPECVTIFGESAGAYAVYSLLAMPAAKGLFHRAVCQSGGGGSTQPTVKQAAEAMQQLLELTKGETLEYLLDCDVAEILAAQEKMAGLSGNPFAPTVEDRTMPKQPLEAIAAGAAAGVPLLLGTNRDEPKLFVAARGREMTGTELRKWVGRTLGLPGAADPSSHDATAVATLVEVFRTTRKTAGLATPGTAENVDLADAIGAEMWHGSCHNLALAQAMHAPTFVYLFTHESPAMRGLLGAAHALEIPFVFGTFNSSAVQSSDQAAAPVAIPDPQLSRFAGAGVSVEQLGREMQQAWLTFARTGTPTTSDTWPSYEEQTRPTMIFGAGVTSSGSVIGQGGGSLVVLDPMRAEREAVDVAIGEARRGATLGL